MQIDTRLGRLNNAIWSVILALALCLTHTTALSANPMRSSCADPEALTLQHLCSDEDNVAVIELADALSSITGLVIDYSLLDETDRDWNDYGIEQVYYPSLQALAQVVSKDLLNPDALGILSSLRHWTPEYYEEHDVLVLQPVSDRLQQHLFVLTPADHASGSYVEINTHNDAIGYQYNFEGDILIARSSSSHASFSTKYRFQDGCWRLIGADRWWNSFLVGTDLREESVNYLTGRAILTLHRNGPESPTYEEELSFETGRICLGDPIEVTFSE
ncbi:hypothetical protein [Roseobacter sp. HKCCA0882]|uniref:hypothetical protein n=1 Tax=Roseobacter sp. HKCCA0882 TaxID=3120337 RepID=UPI0030ED54B1